MNNYTFEQIKKSVFTWSKNYTSNKIDKVKYFEITKNEKDVLLINLTFENCLAQIIVSNSNFAPYQFVSFEAMTLESKKSRKSGTPEMVYFFYDYEGILENMLLEELKFGINLCSDYIPDKLAEMYINKKGILILENENLYHVMHLNDIKKYSKNLLVGDFICTSTHSQYLVVENNLISLRVLPQVFTTN